MKKVLSTALALGLVAGVAATASAYDKFEISGYYTLQGLYADNAAYGNGVFLQYKGDTGDLQTAFWQQDMRLYPNLTVNDKVRLKSEIRLMDTQLWGSAATTNGSGAVGTDATTGRNTDINKLYMEYDSPVGMVRLGRIPFGTYGYSNFNDSAGRADGIVWGTNFLPKPFSLTMVTAKYNENDATGTANRAFVTALSTTVITSVSKANDADVDWYSVHLDYKTDTVMAGTRFILIDDQDVAHNNYSNWNWQGYGKMSIDNLYFGGEFSHAFGEQDHDGATPDEDDDKWALMLEAGGKFGQLDAGLSYWWISGDTDNDNDNEAFGDAGNDWQPLLILTHEHMRLLNNKKDSSNTSNNYMAGIQEMGANVIMASFGMPVSDKLKVNSKIAYAWADEDFGGAVDDEYGWEIDLGASYKLLDNLTYSVNFGYLDAGDYFTNPLSTTTIDDSKEDSVYLLHHSLNMTF